MYVCTYVRTYVCMYVCMYVRTYVFMYVCMYVSVSLYICLSVCLYTLNKTCTLKLTYSHRHPYKHTHTHTHTHRSDKPLVLLVLLVLLLLSLSLLLLLTNTWPSSSRRPLSQFTKSMKCPVGRSQLQAVRGVPQMFLEVFGAVCTEDFAIRLARRVYTWSAVVFWEARREKLSTNNFLHYWSTDTVVPYYLQDAENKINLLLLL